MKTINRWPDVSRAFVAGLLLAVLTACAATPPVPNAAPEVLGGRTQQEADWREEVIYFALTDRFANGNETRVTTAARPAPPMTLNPRTRSAGTAATSPG